MQRRIAGFLVVVFAFTNVLFAYQPETSLWQERKNQVQLASLTLPAFPPAPLKTVPAVSAPKKVQHIANLPATIFSHVRLAERHEASSPNGRVLFLQDVHQNADAQNHLAQVLKKMSAAGGKTVAVGLEGTNGDLGVAAYHAGGEREISDAVAESFFASGDLSGPMYAALTTHAEKKNAPLDFYGVDDAALHAQNVAAYKAAHKDQASVLKSLKARRKEIARKKESIYNPLLKAFDARVQQYRSNEGSLADYLPLLAKGSHSLQVEIFLEASRLEKEMDQRRVEAERAHVLEKLTSKLNKSELDTLLARSLQVQNGEESHASYYGFFKTICERHGVDLNKTPAFNDYVRYVILSGEIKPETLFAETRRMEEKTFAALVKNSAERALVQQDRRLFLSEKLADFALVPEEWSEYKTLSPTPLPVGEGLGERAFQRFYELADARNEAMVDNLLASANKSKTSTMVLVAGGFHTAGITRLLKQKNISYITAVPKINNVDTAQGSAYLSVFDREKTPLELILSGRQLFLADNPNRFVPEAAITKQAMIASVRPDHQGPVTLQRGGETLKFYAGKQPRLWQRALLSPVTAVRRIANKETRWFRTRHMRLWIVAAIMATGGALYTDLISISPKVLSYLSMGAGALAMVRYSQTPEQHADELATLEKLDEELKKEDETPGSGTFESIVYISDQHGTIDKFDALVLDALRRTPAGKSISTHFNFSPDVPYERQLNAIGKSLNDFKGEIFFHNLGDLLDRGPNGLQVFEHSEELINFGLSDFVMGNHDLWAYMNLKGLHLPWYETFNFYGYIDEFDAHFGNVKDLAIQQTNSGGLQPAWWAKKWAEFTSYQQARQKNYWGKTVDVLVNGEIVDGKQNPATGLYARVSSGLDAKQVKLWNKLRGDNGNDTRIQTGTRAVGEVSLVWWKDLLKEFKAEYSVIQEQAGFDETLPSNVAWSEAIDMMEGLIIPELRSEIEQRVKAGDWWWRVFEAINSQNYSSPEWWAKDWLFHDKWGTSVLKELNAMGDEDEEIVTPANYLLHPMMRRLTDFYDKNFNLYVRDQYQDVGFHAYLPVDPTGHFSFTYKGVKYVGVGSNGRKRGWDEGLTRIARDVREAAWIFDVYEAFALINYWYADNTTHAKRGSVAEIENKFGPEKIAQRNGMLNLYFWGHIPFHEFYGLGKATLGIIWSFITNKTSVKTDHGMGERFGARGAYVWRTPVLAQLIGYEHKDSRKIVENPRTVKTVAGVDTVAEEVLFQNPPLEREDSLPRVKSAVQKRIQQLRDMLKQSSGVQSNLSIGFALFGASMVQQGNPWGYPLQFLGIAGMALMALGMVYVSAPASTDSAVTEVQKHYPNLDGKNIFEVAMEMSLTPDLFKKLEAKSAEFQNSDNVSWHEIMQRVAMGESIGGIGPLLSERFMKLADLGAKVYAVAPLYNQVYFQRVKDGQFTIERLDSGKYLRSVLEDTKHTLHVKLYNGNVVHVKVWQSIYKNSVIYYLDAPEIFTVAYEKKEESEERTQQNWTLARGSLYLAKEFNIQPDIMIQSETPTVYANARLFSDELQNDPFFHNTIRIYNDHTPVPYAHPHLSLKRVQELLLRPMYYLRFPSKVTQGGDGEYYVVPPETPLEEGGQATVDMTKVLIIASDDAYAVSREHKKVMQYMPVLRDVANLVSHITNGVLPARWQAPEFANADKMSDDELIAAKQAKKEILLNFVKDMLGKDDGWKERVAGLTVVRFMRRITGYKRFDLINEILTDSAKLDEFIASETMLLLGGRVHQEDDWSKRQVNFLAWLVYAPADQLVNHDKMMLLSQGDVSKYEMISTTLKRLAADEELLQKVRDRVLFFPNYNIYDAPILVQGADATVMMADKGKEAAATGFQKDQMNGSIVLAVGEEGAIDESVYFAHEERLDVLVDALSKDHSDKGRKDFAYLAGNGFEIPSNGPNVDNNGKYTGPTSRGLLDTIIKLSNVRHGKTPLGKEGHPEIYPMMMRNAIATTPQVSVERTAMDMLAFMSNLVRRHDHEEDMYNLGARLARNLHDRQWKLREWLRDARNGEPFTWTYFDGKARHQPLYRHEGPHGHDTGILNLIEGFHQIIRMGRLGRWSILFHTADPDNNHLINYVRHLVANSPELQKQEEFNQSLTLLELEMKSIANSIHSLERTIDGLRVDLAVAADRTLIKGVQDKLTEAENQLTTNQDALVGQAYYLFGFLEATVKPASELRKNTRWALRDILPAAAIAPIFLLGNTNIDWLAISFYGLTALMIGSTAAALFYVGRWAVKGYLNQQRDVTGTAMRLKHNLGGVSSARNDAERAEADASLAELLAPIEKLGVRDLGRLKRTPTERRAALFEIFLALSTDKYAPTVRTAEQFQENDMNLIIPGTINLDEIRTKLDGFYSNAGSRNMENKVLLAPEAYAQYRRTLNAEFSGLTFLNINDIRDVKELATLANGTTPRQVNLLFDDASYLPTSLVDALYSLSETDRAFRDRIVLQYLKNGFAAASSYMFKLNEMIGFALLAGSQA